jgi:DNA end-binding protein Ku
MLELTHFPQEVLDASEIKAPAEKPISKTGMQMPRQLIESITSKWEPERYSDEYHQAPLLENVTRAFPSVRLSGIA